MWPFSRKDDPPFDEEAVEELLQHYASKRAAAGTFFDSHEGGVPLAWLLRQSRAYARLIADALDTRSHRFSPGQLRVQRIADKDRELAGFEISDLLLHYVASKLIEQLTAKDFSPHVYSYARGRSYLDAVHALARFLRQAQRGERPTDRHLWVIQRDIAAYYDSVPVHPRAPLWSQLRRLVDASTLTSDDRRTALWLFENTLRPELRRPDGSLFVPTFGLTTGSPVSPPVANLYLADMDRALGRLEGGFYARYGDDFIYIHADKSRALQAEAIIASITRGLGLRLHPKKVRNTYLTACGRASPDPVFRGASSIELLGFMIRRNGAVGLKQARIRGLLGDLRARTRRTMRLLPTGDVDARGEAACAVLNEALDPASGVSAKAAIVLRHVVTDRAQLGALDRALALLVVRAATGSLSVRGFRRTPWKKIHSDWGLVSLTHARNRVGR